MPGVVYAVTPESAVRLQGRGFQIADDVTDTADGPQWSLLDGSDK